MDIPHGHFVERALEGPATAVAFLGSGDPRIPKTSHSAPNDGGIVQKRVKRSRESSVSSHVTSYAA
ncbi:MAG: hypothetical protein ABI895_28345 [Deltaproteobacteria bacterium]